MAIEIYQIKEFLKNILGYGFVLVLIGLFVWFISTGSDDSYYQEPTREELEEKYDNLLDKYCSVVKNNDKECIERIQLKKEIDKSIKEFGLNFEE